MEINFTQVEGNVSVKPAGESDLLAFDVTSESHAAVPGTEGVGIFEGQTTVFLDITRDEARAVANALLEWANE